MVVIRLLLMMVALERYNKRAQWHQVNPSPPNSRVRLTSGTHQHNFIHTYTFEPLPPFKWTLQDSFTHFTQSCVHFLLLKGPTYRWNTSAQLIHTYTSYARLWTSSPFQVEHFSTTYTSYTKLISYSRVRLTCATFQQSFILRILL